MNHRQDETPRASASRREFLKRTTATGAVLAAGLSAVPNAHAAGSDEVKIALVGCGGRGTGAAANAIKNRGGARVKLYAMADAFREKLDRSYKAIKKRVIAMVERSDFFLVERLAERIAELCLESIRVRRVRVCVAKPAALRFARTVEVEIVRKQRE